MLKPAIEVLQKFTKENGHKWEIIKYILNTFIPKFLHS